MARALRGWNLFWFSEIPGRSYTTFRIVHGCTLLLFLAKWWLHAAEWIGTDGFHFPDAIVAPLPNALLPYFAALQFGALGMFIFGRGIRSSAIICWLCLMYVTLIDRIAAFSINNIYLFTLAVFVVYPFGNRNSTIVAVPVRLLQLGMVAIYFSSGWNKAVFGDWLAWPNVLQSALSGIYMNEAAAWALRMLPGWIWTILQYFTLVFELFSPVLFFSRRWRCFAMVAGCFFHIGIAVFMDQLIFFSLQMMSFYLLFDLKVKFLPSWPSRFRKA